MVARPCFLAAGSPISPPAVAVAVGSHGGVGCAAGLATGPVSG